MGLGTQCRIWVDIGTESQFKLWIGVSPLQKGTESVDAFCSKETNTTLNPYTLRGTRHGRLFLAASIKTLGKGHMPYSLRSQVSNPLPAIEPKNKKTEPSTAYTLVFGGRVPNTSGALQST